MDIIKKHLTNGQYMVDVYSKKSIFLHHTAGTSAMGAWRWWNSTPDRVGTPFIIDRDGSIIECFDPSYWAYHLGVTNDDNFQEKYSINIEIVSAGQLRLESEEFRFYPLWPNRTRYSVIPKDEVIEIKDGWRGYNYFQKYTMQQIKSLEWLLGKLYNDFPSLLIGSEILPETFFEYNEEVLTKHLGGIWAHSTVRKDKSDIYPDKRIIRVLKTLKKNLSTPI